jgi:uncharacterized protein YfeS
MSCDHNADVVEMQETALNDLHDILESDWPDVMIEEMSVMHGHNVLPSM